MDGVWEAIEEEQVPVSHHIGESPPSSPNEFNPVILGMLQAVAPFRDLFGKYVLGGILDRHPGLRVGWFEGGINWVPSALQDAEHLSASFRHIANLKTEHEPRYYWEHNMYASFMVDPLGLDLVDRIGVDKVFAAMRARQSLFFRCSVPSISRVRRKISVRFISSAGVYNESTYGYSSESLKSVVDAVGVEAATAMVSDNIKRYLGVAD